MSEKNQKSQRLVMVNFCQPVEAFDSLADYLTYASERYDHD